MPPWMIRSQIGLLKQALHLAVSEKLCAKTWMVYQHYARKLYHLTKNHARHCMAWKDSRHRASCLCWSAQHLYHTNAISASLGRPYSLYVRRTPAQETLVWQAQKQITLTRRPRNTILITKFYNIFIFHIHIKIHHVTHGLGDLLASDLAY